MFVQLKMQRFVEELVGRNVRAQTQECGGRHLFILKEEDNHFGFLGVRLQERQGGVSETH